MKPSRMIRRTLAILVGIVVVLIGSAVMLAVALDAGHFRHALIRFAVARSGRQIGVEGPLAAHLFSRHPWLSAERVTIGNPPWMPAGRTAEIGNVSLAFTWPWVGRSFGIERLVMDAAVLHLQRDAAGRANWQWRNPDEGATELPLIRSLSMPNAQVDLHDDRRHLQFLGSASAADMRSTADPPRLRIAGEGDLNGRAATFEILADPLATASRQRPFAFTFDEHSGGSHLTGRGFLLSAFDFDALDTTFDVAGENLKDLYYLAGVALINTGRFHLSGKLARRGTQSRFSELDMLSGQSDVRGQVSIDSSAGRPKLNADLSSQLLRMSDLGARAAAGDSEAQSRAPLLLSNASFNPETLRRGDAVVIFHAARVDVGRMSMKSVVMRTTIQNGMLTAAPFSANVSGGKLTAHVGLDANTDDPKANVDLQIADLQLGALPYKHPDLPPMDGTLQVRITVTGHGRSIHQVAASANGKVTAIIPRGNMRASLAELIGIDFRGLRLFLTKSPQDTAIRCAVASFQAHNGNLTANTLIMDTDAVFIDGAGAIALDSETLELEMHGHPKGLRIFELHAPMLVRGTLAKPSFDIQAQHAALKVVDRGVAKNADCAALMAAEKK